MLNPAFVAFEEAEVPLLRVALAERELPTKSQLGRLMAGEHISEEEARFYAERGEVFKQASNGWIFFHFPYGVEHKRNEAQVWAGCRDSERSQLPAKDTLLAHFEPGVLDADKVLLRVTSRQVHAMRHNYFEAIDPTLPARQWLRDGIDWIVQQTLSLREL